MDRETDWPAALTPKEYTGAKFHVEKRNHLDETVRSVLFAPLPDNTFARHRGEAEFWLQVHQGLLRTSAALPDWCEQFLSRVENEQLPLMAPRIVALASQLLHHAHSHHHIEDHHFFPVFLRSFPQLERPLDLLEKDHEILTVVLDGIEKAAFSLQSAVQADKNSQRDKLMSAAEEMHQAGKRLDALFIRHIADEEEICLPSLMKL